MYLKIEDYRSVVGLHELNTIQQFDDDVRVKAEKGAIEEISAFLRPYYDTVAIFATVGDARNEKINMLVADITLYHLATWLPGKMGLEIRIERYEKAIKFLNLVSAGKVVLDIPLATDDDGEAQGMKYGGEQKNEYSW